MNDDLRQRIEDAIYTALRGGGGGWTSSLGSTYSVTASSGGGEGGGRCPKCLKPWPLCNVSQTGGPCHG